METLLIIIKLGISLTLLNVWLVRFNRSTSYRGGSAENMEQEFQEYGLPVWSTYAVGTLKVGLAVLLILSIFFPILETWSLLGIGLLMCGSVFMHLKVNDEFKKSIPALTLLLLTIISLVL